jgi:Flp pilus assembly protein CpaB
MQPSRLPLLLALITFCLTVLSGAYTYDRYLRTVPALVATRDLAAGTPLTQELVRVIRIPAGGTPPQALYGPGQVAGMYAAMPLLEGQVLSARQITADPPVQDPLNAVRPDQRVIAVPVRPEAALGGALRPGDLVDVAAARPTNDGKSAPVDLLMSSIRVVELRGSSVQTLAPGTADSARDAAPASVLLVVSADQAKTLVSAVQSNATLYLWLAGRGR